MRVTELDYELPADRIAAQPAEPRDSARLMVVHRGADRLEHRQVRDLPELGLIQSGDLLVFNRSKVIPARFPGIRKRTGGKVEGLYLHAPHPSDDGSFSILLEARGSLRAHERIVLDDAHELELCERREGGQWRAILHGPTPMPTLLERIGSPPLPPYILKERKARELPRYTGFDLERYNTVYAREPGSVAAPTAGLHFTPELLSRFWAYGIHSAWVTLHVGLGTFAPVRTESLAEHAMHEEWISVPAETLRLIRATRARGGKIIPIGTTTVRALESLPAEALDLDRGYAGWTKLFIYPGRPEPFAFRFTDALMTNFHLPRSTLLALVASLPEVGIQRLRRWYQTAITAGYRFYSYGDAMWLA